MEWDNKYIYYCPLDFIFIAVPVMDEYDILTSGVIIGPILMGELTDFEETYDLPQMDTGKVNDLAEIASSLFSVKEQATNKETMSDFLNAIYRELEILPQSNEYPIDLEKRLQEASLVLLRFLFRAILLAFLCLKAKRT